MTKFNTICETQHYDARTTGKIERLEVMGSIEVLNWVYENSSTMSPVGRAMRGKEAWTLETCEGLERAIGRCPLIQRHGVEVTMTEMNDRHRWGDEPSNRVRVTHRYTNVNNLTYRCDKLFTAFEEIIARADSGGFDCLVQTPRGMDLRDAGDTKISDRSPLILLALRERQAIEDPGEGWRRHEDSVVVGHNYLVRNLSMEMDDEPLGVHGQMLHELINPDSGDLGQDWTWFDEHAKALTVTRLDGIRHLPPARLVDMVKDIRTAEKSVEERRKRVQSHYEALEQWEDSEWVEAHVKEQQATCAERIAKEKEWLAEAKATLDDHQTTVARLEKAVSA